MAIVGQLAAILIAWRFYDIDLNLMFCLMAVGAAVLANLVAIFLIPQSRRLTETETILMLLFDTMQLSVLIFLTGGLNNPFALLFLAPSTIAATTLRMRSTALVGLVTIALVTFVAFFHLPLQTISGDVIGVPDLFGFGFWLAIVIGVVFLGQYEHRVASEIHSMSEALLATQMALSREQKLTDLGGVVAAAAHELGTPLATIKLVSTEMVADLSDQPERRQDAELIREQADRCRDILRSMGRAGKDDLHLRSAPLVAILAEAAEPHLQRGKALHFDTDIAPDQPDIFRKPEIIHGLRNLIQNAVDFAQSDVWIDTEWDLVHVLIRIVDNGAGYPPHLIGRIGDPLMRGKRNGPSVERPEYDGMGLGLFIAKTLLERTGARLNFFNASDPFLSEDERPARSGAVVEIIWKRRDIEADRVGALGENQLF
jgi:two-component system sensor histidine kinase RegB